MVTRKRTWVSSSSWTVLANGAFVNNVKLHNFKSSIFTKRRVVSLSHGTLFTTKKSSRVAARSGYVARQMNFRQLNIKETLGNPKNLLSILLFVNNVQTVTENWRTLLITIYQETPHYSFLYLSESPPADFRSPNHLLIPTTWNVAACKTTTDTIKINRG